MKLRPVTLGVGEAQGARKHLIWRNLSVVLVAASCRVALFASKCPKSPGLKGTLEKSTSCQRRGQTSILQGCKLCSPTDLSLRCAKHFAS